jgi:hypothetical protein
MDVPPLEPVAAILVMLTPLTARQESSLDLEWNVLETI